MSWPAAFWGSGIDDEADETRAELFPVDQNGDEVPFRRSDVVPSHSTWIHVWMGDERGGRHDPFGPYEVNKTLFPRRWFGSADDPDYEAAENEIMHALREAPVVVSRDTATQWTLYTYHDDVVIEHHVDNRAGVPIMGSTWPINGTGVRVVTSLRPLTLDEAGPAIFPPRRADR